MSIRKIKLVFVSLAAVMLVFLSCKGEEPTDNNGVNRPKYIFLFIGDGMGQNHVALTQAYMASSEGKIGMGKVFFTDYPSYADCTTWCRNSQITDSGAAGSAIACGEKADYGVISYYPEFLPDNMPQSIAKIAHLNGMKAGIISTVSINHATPAAFYAVNESRGNYYEIGAQMPESGFEFYGGGGFKNPTGENNDKENLYQRATNLGYVITSDLNTISTTDTSVTGVYFVNPVLRSESEMPYSIDREELGGYALKDIVREAIRFLDNKNGFFMMVEGGKIDWASHENDAATVVNELIDFDNAVLEAYAFYMLHPDETLIIVTADHETGGFSLGNTSNDYDSNFGILGLQKCSVSYFAGLLSAYKQSTTVYELSYVTDLAMTDFFNQPLNLTSEDSVRITEAFNYYFNGVTNMTDSELYSAYGSSNPVAVTFSKILSDRAGVGFTTWAHTAAKVPVYSTGLKSLYFTGGMDNTGFHKRLVDFMGWQE